MAENYRTQLREHETKISALEKTVAKLVEEVKRIDVRYAQPQNDLTLRRLPPIKLPKALVRLNIGATDPLGA